MERFSFHKLLQVQLSQLRLFGHRGDFKRLILDQMEALAPIQDALEGLDLPADLGAGPGRSWRKFVKNGRPGRRVDVFHLLLL